MRAVLPERPQENKPVADIRASLHLGPSTEGGMDIDQDSAGVKFPPPLAFAGTLIAGLAIDHFMWWHFGIPLTRYLRNLLGWTAAVAGFAIMMTAFGLFKKAGTDPKPWKTPSAFVTDGVYRWTRNPMYLGMVLIYAGIAILANSVVTLLLLVPLFIWVTREVIEREEAYLTVKFGEPYRAYKAETRRWF
jgi:protein-S-isoprenylcysteine O-methyltransferase Ste14